MLADAITSPWSSTTQTERGADALSTTKCSCARACSSLIRTILTVECGRSSWSDRTPSPCASWSRPRQARERCACAASAQACAAPTSTSCSGSLDAGGCASRSSPGTRWSGASTRSVTASPASRAGERVVCEGNSPLPRVPALSRGRDAPLRELRRVGFTRGRRATASWWSCPRGSSHASCTVSRHVSFDAAVLVEPGYSRPEGARARTHPAGGDGRSDRRRRPRRDRTSRSRACTHRRGSWPMACARKSWSSHSRSGPTTSSTYGSTDAEAETTRLRGRRPRRRGRDGWRVDALELSTRIAREGGRIATLGIAGPRTRADPARRPDRPP